MKIYISFGQSHRHEINGEVFDKDCLAEIECDSHSQGRETAFENFGAEFFTSYESMELGGILRHFHRGVIKLT